MCRTFLKIGIAWCLLSLSLGANAKPPVILVYGDSLSAGYGLAREQSWPSLLQQKLTTRYTVINASVSGETTAGGLTRLAKTLQIHQPAIVILALGANDGLRGLPLEMTRKNLIGMIQQIQTHKAKVLLVGLQIPPNFGQEYAQNFAQLYPSLSTRYKTGFVPFLLQGIADKPALFQADQLHPTAQAQPMLMENVYRYLSRLLYS
jgi:acyl-CoA thioesterase-1